MIIPISPLEMTLQSTGLLILWIIFQRSLALKGSGTVIFMLVQHQQIVSCCEEEPYIDKWGWCIIWEVINGYHKLFSLCLYSDDDSNLDNFPGECACALEGMETTISKEE